jgi:hypothetical protein
MPVHSRLSNTASHAKRLPLRAASFKSAEELLAQLSLLWEAGLTMGEVSAFTEMTRPRCQRARKTDCGRTEGVN